MSSRRAFSTFSIQMSASTALVALVILARTAAAGTAVAGLDVEGWLRKPGVGHLVVVYQAPDCTTCKGLSGELPRLMSRYKSVGTRIIHVLGPGQEGPPLSLVSEVVTDDSGTIRRALGSSKTLEAWVWSWRGQLLLEGGSLDDVEGVLDRATINLPDTEIAVFGPTDPKEVSSMVTALSGAISRSGKLRASLGGESATMAFMRQCEGPDEGSRWRVQATLPASGAGSMSLHLLDLAGRCSLSSSSVPYEEARRNDAARVSLDQALDALRLERPDLPTPRTPPPRVTVTRTVPAPIPVEPSRAEVSPNKEGIGLFKTPSRRTGFDGQTPAHYALVAAGLAAVGSGSAWVLAFMKRREADEASTPEALDSAIDDGKTFETTAWVLAATAGGLTAVGSLFLLLDDQQGGDSMGFVPLKGGFAAGLSGRF